MFHYIHTSIIFKHVNFGKHIWIHTSKRMKKNILILKFQPGMKCLHVFFLFFIPGWNFMHFSSLLNRMLVFYKYFLWYFFSYDFFNFFRNIFSSNAIKVVCIVRRTHFITIHIQSYPMSSDLFILVKIYHTCPVLYFRWIIS